MKLAIFDLDGTLVSAESMDSRCFQLAFKKVFGISHVDPSWVPPDVATDTGYANVVIEKHFHRAGKAEEIRQVRDRYVSLLADVLRSGLLTFHEVDGASRILDKIRTSMDWRAAIATGCWARSAALKLRHSGVCVNDVPVATSDGVADRLTILKNSILLAKEAYGIQDFQRIVGIGDSHWDIIAARSLQLPLVLVRHNRYPAPEGNVCVIENYRDEELFFRSLDNARPPSGINC
jgi:phosphoglycolate phosphatase-like HAD superfamily hydrolase